MCKGKSAWGLCGQNILGGKDKTKPNRNKQQTNIKQPISEQKVPTPIGSIIVK